MDKMMRKLVTPQNEKRGSSNSFSVGVRSFARAVTSVFASVVAGISGSSAAHIRHIRARRKEIGGWARAGGRMHVNEVLEREREGIHVDGTNAWCEMCIVGIADVRVVEVAVGGTGLLECLLESVLPWWGCATP